ncbi:MAG: zinc dependent phospholipase C family protein [Candidatus Aenigmatarchaeota archaeon]
MRFLLLILLFIPLVYSWGFETHEWICKQLVIGNQDLRNTVNENDFIRGCNAPDTEIKDQLYHNCYYARECKHINTEIKDPVSLAYFTEIKDCFEKDLYSCPALLKFNASIAKNDSYWIGASIHYLSDAFTPVHQITGEDYYRCHKPFEDKIDKKLKEKNWIVRQDCEFSFPCSKAGSMIRKCQTKYNSTIEFSYDNLVELVVVIDKEVSHKLKINEGRYESLKQTGMIALIKNKIIELFNHFVNKLPFSK